MSLVILGMEMPECCQDCEGHLVGEWNEYDEMCNTCIFVLSEHPWEPKHKEIDGIDTSKSIPDWCPLRPLPEKHGDLIDRDAMLFSVLVLGLEGERAIETAPAIVEAEGD